MTDPAPASPASPRAYVLTTCFIALIATSFAFVIRLIILDEWAVEYGFSDTQKGELLGAGVWPFAISIILFSLIIDRIGYGRAMWFAFACHVVSVIVTVTAEGYWGLYLGNFICALGNGTVEAVINPVIAAMFWKHKTKWLNILHAGWPGGLIVGGLLTLAMLPENPLGGLLGATAENPQWRWKVGLLLLPTVIYGVMLLGTRFPVSERVAAGLPYRAMLREFGAMGALISGGLIIWQLMAILAGATQMASGVWMPIAVAIIAITTVAYGLAVGALGRPLFAFLLLVMILLATTEIGSDGWIASLMRPVMDDAFGLDGGWVLVYTATIMMLLRLFCGPIVKRLNPLGMLAVSSLFAAAGLAFLSTASGVIIILAATVYGIGQTFFWPTTLGLVAERFPKGGALTLNAIAGVGMLGVGILGFPLLGNVQDRHTAAVLEAQQPALASAVFSDLPTTSVLGNYRKLDADKVEALTDAQKTTVTDIQDDAKQQALLQVAVLPLIMFACYIGLIFWFKSRGGYQAELLEAAHTGEPDGENTG
ncbi:MAG: MFS transporter [Planctomycetota bacterium]